MQTNFLQLIGYTIGIYLIIKFLQKILLFLKKIKSAPKQKKIFLSEKVKTKADRKFSKLLNKFKRKYKRKPSQNDLFRLIINASHITIRRKGGRGHWGRQKVRKYLLEKYHIMKIYKMR